MKLQCYIWETIYIYIYILYNLSTEAYYDILYTYIRLQIILY
jgi:hypothetical protein